MPERIRNLESLNDELGRIDWRTKTALGHAANILADVGAERLRNLYDRTLLESEGPTYERLLALSRRKPTHTKIYLGGGMPDSLTQPVVWVNDYQQPMPCAGPYVDKYHNHRSPFVSIQLEEEGYTEDRLTASETDPDDYSLWIPPDWDAAITTRYTRGDICVMPNTRDIHRVHNQAGALTLMVNSPRKRHVTEVFNDDGSYVTYPDLHQQLFSSQLRAFEERFLQQQQDNQPSQHRTD